MKQLRLLAKRVLSLIPTKLPTGMTEFNQFVADIIELVPGLADDRSIRFTVASMIMHLGPQRSHVAKNYFVRSLQKTAANQISHAVMLDIKKEQEEQRKAEATAAQQENNNSEQPKTESQTQ